MKRGPKTKPPAAHKAAGTFRPVRHAGLTEIAVPDDLPAAPEWLTEAGAAEWDELVLAVTTTRRASSVDAMLLGQLANLGGAMAQCWKTGAVPPAAHLMEFRRLCELFGLAGLSSRVGTKGATPAAPTNAFLAIFNKPGPPARSPRRVRSKPPATSAPLPRGGLSAAFHPDGPAGGYGRAGGFPAWRARLSVSDARARLDRVLAVLVPAMAQLDPTDAAWAAEQFEPAGLALHRRTATRDALVLAELARTPGPHVTAKAAALERRLNRATSGTRDEIATTIINLSAGREPITWRHICRIEREARAMCKDRAGDAHGAPSRSAA